MIKKVSAVITAIFMLASMSACSAQSFGLNDQDNAGHFGLNDQDNAGHSGNKNALSDGDTAESNGIESVEDIYSQGIQLLKSGKYVEARAAFERCGDYGFARDLKNVCEAENEFSKGNYEAAKSYYSSVSEKAEVQDFPVQAKKANIATRIELEKLTGNYYPSYNRITMDKYKKKKVIGWWRNVGTWGQQYLTVSYKENEDGTFDVTGEVQFKRYTKFAKKKSGIKQGTYKLPINLKNISQFQENDKFTLAKGVTLTYKHSMFELNYSKTENNKKKKTKVVYKSQVTYKKS